MSKIGIALGGGGAKGLAHIPMLEVLDEFDVQPYQISGSSIGAIIGVLYASGYKGTDIREAVNEMTLLENDRLLDSFKQKSLLKWFEYIDIDWSGNALLKADTFLSDVMNGVKVTSFEALKYPLKVVAADFWKREQVVFESGDLRQAIHASMALPGIFKPVLIGEQVLIDGGAVNPVPFDVLDECDTIIAINVMGDRTESVGRVPDFFDAVFNTFQIMQNTILQHKLLEKHPDIYIEPDIVDIRMLDFYKAEAVFKQADKAKDALRKGLESVLRRKSV